MVHLFEVSFICHTNSLFPIKLSFYAWATCDSERILDEFTSQTGYRLSRIIRLYGINSANERECSMGYSVTRVDTKLVGSSNRGLKSTLSRLHDLIPKTGYFHFSHTKCQKTLMSDAKDNSLVFLCVCFHLRNKRSWMSFYKDSCADTPQAWLYWQRRFKEVMESFSSF